MKRMRYKITENIYLSVYRNNHEILEHYSIDYNQMSYHLSNEQMDNLYKYIHRMFNEYTMLRDFRAYFNEFNIDEFIKDLQRLDINVKEKIR